MWSERCRDDRYVVNALCCDVWVLSPVSLIFGEVFFSRSASLHDLFLYFLAKCLFCNFFGVFHKLVGVNEHGGWCWNGACLRMLRVERIGFDLYSSQHQEGL